MKKQRFFFFILFILLAGKSFPQGFQLSQPRLEVAGNELSIYYDIIGSKPTDKLFIRVEISRADGTLIPAKALSGDFGEYVNAGKNKKIIWNAEMDSVYLNEPVSVELKAEKYIRPFPKGSRMLLSTVFPGWGQTKNNNSKPWWLTGIVAYGGLAGGIVMNQNYTRTYNSYKVEMDPDKRASLASKSQKQLNFSNVMLISSASIWAANILWIAFTPDDYKPLQYIKLSLNKSYLPYSGNPVMLSLKIDF